MKPLTMADIEAELREEIENIRDINGAVTVSDYAYLDGLKHGLIAGICRQNGWAKLPTTEGIESARLQKWLVGVCAK